MKKEFFSIYLMRCLAIFLIVNSHFNAKHIESFKPFFTYGYLGSLGNMIFFFISSYVLTKTFFNYDNCKMRWVIYRFLYLVITVVTIRFVFESYANGIQNIFMIFLSIFEKLDFVSSMLYLSALFPLLYSMRRIVQLVLIAVLFGCICVFAESISVDQLNFLTYCLSFVSGSFVAETKWQPNSKSSIIGSVVFLALFIVAKITHNDVFVAIPAKLLFIIFLFYSVDSFSFVNISRYFKKGVKEFAKLSLFIYFTHFYFIQYAYSINRHTAVFILLSIILPICYLEAKFLNIGLNRVKYIIFKPR